MPVGRIPPDMGRHIVVADTAVLETEGALLERALRETREEMQSRPLVGGTNHYNDPVLRMYQLLHEEAVIRSRLREVLQILDERDELAKALSPVGGSVVAQQRRG